MLNRIILMGRITKEPELRRTAGGMSVTTITVAVERDFKSGERETDFIDVVAWRSTAEFLCKYFGKGRMIVVEGSLQSRKWTDRNGQNRTSYEVQADRLYFGDSKREDSSNTYDERRAPAKPQIVQVDEEEESGELPF